MAAYRTSWDLSARDVVPELSARARPADVGAALLYAMLQARGAAWSPPYETVRRNLGIRSKNIEPEREEQADQRLRTWMVLFRSIGLLYEEDGLLVPTQTGEKVRELLDSWYDRTDDFALEVSLAGRWKLARLIAPSLARVQLRNPLTLDAYSEDVDIHPLWAIWRAMLQLDRRLHWDELDRTLTKCLRMRDLDVEIDKVRVARQASDYDVSNPDSLEAYLGPRAPIVNDDDQQDRVIPWLSRAGFKDILLEPRNRADGFRYLREEFIPLLTELTAVEPPHNDSPSATSYFDWLGQEAADQVVRDSPLGNNAMLNAVVERCRTSGQRQIVALEGPAGTGKTMLAREAARVLTGNDPSRIRVVQFHAAFSYEEFIGGLAPEGGTFVPKPGVLLEFNAEAQLRPTETHVLVIDELSRADVANVLGELLTYIEYRDQSFRVAALASDVSLSPNLIVLATLNPNDRSVVNLDDALVRRIRHVEIKPDSDALQTILDESGMAVPLRDEVVRWFRSLPLDVPFGHGLFVGVTSPRDLHDLWHEQLVYFLRRGGVTSYHDPEAVQSGYVWRLPEFSADWEPDPDGASSRSGEVVERQGPVEI